MDYSKFTSLIKKHENCEKGCDYVNCRINRPSNYTVQDHYLLLAGMFDDKQPNEKANG